MQRAGIRQYSGADRVSMSSGRYPIHAENGGRRTWATCRPSTKSISPSVGGRHSWNTSSDGRGRRGACRRARWGRGDCVAPVDAEDRQRGCYPQLSRPHPGAIRPPFGFELDALRRWESGRGAPEKAARSYLPLILRTLRRSSVSPIRYKSPSDRPAACPEGRNASKTQRASFVFFNQIGRSR